MGGLDGMLKTVTAFSNTEGGWLVLGIEDPGKASGSDRLYGIQENPAAVDELRKQLRERITPPLIPPTFIEPVWHEIPCILRAGQRGSLVLLQVAKSSGVHSVVNSGTYTRLDRSNRQLSAVEITDLSMRRGTASWVSADSEVALDLLDTDWWKMYAAQRRLTRPIQLALPYLGLGHLGQDGRVRPTRAAVLLFAEEPAGLLDAKCSLRIFHYRGETIEHTTSTNLLRPPATIGGPILRQIRTATEAVLQILADGVQVGPLGFEIVQRYPARVLQEAITNAVIHRDYRLQADIHVRIFSNRVEVESPGCFPADVTSRNIRYAGSHPRNPSLVNHLREFPQPPNLDAGEGIRMMFQALEEAKLYPPIFRAPPEYEREAVMCVCLNEARADAWTQVAEYLGSHPDIGNAEVRKILATDDPVRASKLLRSWMDRGLLVLLDPSASKQRRRYRLPGREPLPDLFSDRQENEAEGATEVPSEE
jgi:ATP-dependent DNA helicase RecG